MILYHLYLKPRNHWEWECQIEAVDHIDALRKAIAYLKPAHFDSAMRIEQEDGYRIESPDFN